MREKTLLFIIILFLVFGYGEAQIKSLSHIFLLNNGIKDLDGDSIGDSISIRIIIPDNPTPCELAVAAEIAARANFESLAQDLALVKKESEIENIKDLENLISPLSNLTKALYPFFLLIIKKV